ncbi:MAG: polysaccharide deacetylase family protein [Clostridiales Family XIII bacterium]|jgi:peptidoglycan/xylan/chitin deacetylase (PgdA/CDA1 family)|nr:polysaccharide deacetylase family protein [Clostridiales Family XIII bacterium]
MPKTSNGKFIVSLDFEMAWGVRISGMRDSYAPNIANVREVIPRLIDLFGEFGIHATFATVGMLFFSGKADLLENLPDLRPRYKSPGLSPYDGYIDGIDGGMEHCFFAPDLIRSIAAAGHDVGCHTFSHYYCLEEGQTANDFADDIRAAARVMERECPAPASFVFPRNMVNPNYLKILSEAGIASYRGNPSHAFFETSGRGLMKHPQILRLVRLIDSYISVSGDNCTAIGDIGKARPYNIPASRFLRPYSRRLQAFERLRLRRIKKSMTNAARNGMIYHLWWHPHNFGANMNENLAALRTILEHYKLLRGEYSFQSCSMRELSEMLDTRQGGTGGCDNA